MATSPPSYTSNIQNVNAALDAKLFNVQALPQDTLVKIEKAISQRLQKPDVQARLKKEIIDLTTQVLSIESSFLSVSNSLERLISTETPYAQELTGLRDDWAMKSQQYTSFVLESRRAASKAKAAADDFATDFIDLLHDDNTSDDVKRKEIHKYLPVLAERSQESAGISESFKAVRNSVDGFRLKWNDFLKSHPVNGIQHKVNEQNVKIVALTKQLDELDAKFTRLWIELGIAVVNTGVSFGLGFVAPITWIDTVIGAVQLYFSVKDLDEAYDARNALAKEREEEIATSLKYKQQMDTLQDMKSDIALEVTPSLPQQIKCLQIIKSELGLGGGDCKTIVDKLSIFHSTWSRISSDVRDLETRLNDDGKESFYARLDDVRALYKTYALALETYAITMSISKLPKGA